MRIDIFTIFPGMLAGVIGESILKRAQAAGLVEILVHDLRDWTTDRHRSIDDTPYGGGAGMVMMAPPLVAAVEGVLGSALGDTPVLLTAAGGRPFTQAWARELAAGDRLAIICGHYEGIDARVGPVLGATEMSIGDYVLTGGELPALVIADAVARLRPGVIDAASIAEESHEAGLLEYPQYTRPATFRDLTVPEILLSGHHARIAAWRREQAITKTAVTRPDVLASARLTIAEQRLATAARAAAEAAIAESDVLDGSTGVAHGAPDAQAGEVTLGEGAQVEGERPF